MLSELDVAPELQLSGPDDPGRAKLEEFVQTVFARSYGARVTDFHPQLLSIRIGRHRTAVVGLREAASGSLFSEQYLASPLELELTRRCGRPVDRTAIVEIGNLALAQSGCARLVITALTAFVHAAGYQWVVFTAVGVLYNAFRRMGLRPLVLGPARPQCLPDGGLDWGSYYRHAPRVCAGDVSHGHALLARSIGQRQVHLRQLWRRAESLGLNQRSGLRRTGGE